MPLKLKNRAASKPVKAAAALTPTPTKPAKARDITLPLHLKYRPTDLQQVIGQDAVVSALRKTLNGKAARPHAFLFTGPSGTGKTTLARIVAAEVGVTYGGLLEVDAATNSGVDSMRSITEQVRYKSLHGDEGLRFVIVDEAHALSKATWQSMLKAIEEPPPHVYWALCTTEPDKVPETIRTRCQCYALRPVGMDDIADLLCSVRDAEGIELGDDLVELLSRNAMGSVRRALVALEQCAGATDKKEVLRLLETGVGEEEQAIALARMVCNGKGFTWPAASKLVQALEGESPEGVRLIVVNYAAAVLKDTTKPEPLLAVLDAFRGPYNTSERWAPLYLSLGTLLFQ